MGDETCAWQVCRVCGGRLRVRGNSKRPGAPEAGYRTHGTPARRTFLRTKAEGAGRCVITPQRKYNALCCLYTAFHCP